MSFIPPLLSLLDTLEHLQAELESVLASKEQALLGGRPEELTACIQQEAALAQRLQGFAGARSRLLADARRQGQSAGSLKELAGAIGDAQRAAVLERIHLAQERSAHLRRQSWRHWILAHRSYHHYSSLLEIIANHGQSPPTYSDSPSPANAGRGGVVLDASV